jgi:multiple sugar transport system permease protein
MHVLWYKKFKRITKYILLYSILLFFFVIFAFPFYYIFVLASRDLKSIFNIPPPILPGDALISNWNILIQEIPIFLNFMHSLIIAVLATSTVIFFCSLTGFALAKYRFKGRKLTFTIMILTLIIPQFLNIIPAFKLMVWLHWINTYFPMFVPGMANSFGVFLMAQFIQSSVPEDLIDAARIDGLSEFKIFLTIGLPLSTGGIAVLGIITFIGSWNNFLWAMIMLPEKLMHTLPVALSSFFLKSEVAANGYGAKMLGNAFSVLPLLIIFLFFSKKIISNFLAGSLKG